MKNKRLSIIFILLATMIMVPLVSFAQGSLNSAKQVTTIKIKGNKAVSSVTILNKLKMKSGDAFEESALNKELKRLYATGYFADVFVETEDFQEGVTVTFTVVEKPIIERIEFSGNSRLKKKKLKKKISVKAGTLLDFNILGQDAAAIKAFYIEQGYSQSTVDYKIETDPDSGQAVVVFQINEGIPLRIRKIEYEGNNNIPTGELKKYMSTKTAWWFIRKGAFDQDLFDADIDRIRSVYRSKGYLDAKVSGNVEYLDNGKSIHLKIIIDEGKKYLVGNVEIKGELAFPEGEVRKVIKTGPGETFDYSLIKEDIDHVREFYYDKGYMNAEIDMKHRYNAKTDRMDMVYDIVSHEEIYVGRINIIGNTKTKDKVIRRELRVFPGTIYAGEELKRSKEQIYNLGFFEDVYFETVPSGEPNVKDLSVTVKETKTGELSFGGGYSSVDAFIGFVQIRQRNFDLLNFPTFTGSGQDLILRGELGSARNNYLLSWTDPWIFDMPYLFGFDLYRTEQKKFGQSGYDYDEQRLGGALRFGKDITDNLNAGLTYTLEEVELSNIPDNASVALRNERGKNILSRLLLKILYDRRDNRFSPTKGFVTGFNIENTGGFLGGDKDFVKGFAYASVYHSIIKNVVLELKGRGGLAESYNDTDNVPIYERFFAGGATTIRGYEQRAVGPRDPNDTNIPVGGEAILIGNVEVSFPLYKKIIKGAVFYDVGNVWSDITDLSDSSGYKQGAGIGVRVKTPIGPVKLDWGYPLNDNYDDKRKGQFYFSVSHGF